MARLVVVVGSSIKNAEAFAKAMGYPNCRIATKYFAEKKPHESPVEAYARNMRRVWSLRRKENDVTVIALGGLVKDPYSVPGDYSHKTYWIAHNAFPGLGEMDVPGFWVEDTKYPTYDANGNEVARFVRIMNLTSTKGCGGIIVDVNKQTFLSAEAEA